MSNYQSKYTGSEIDFLLNKTEKYVSNPNILINGNFQIWQRESPITGTGIYSADRYITNGTAEKTDNGIKISSNSTTGEWWIRYYFDPPDLERIKNKKVTISFRLRGGRSFPLELRSYISGFNSIANFTTTTEWIVQSYTFEITDISTKPYFGFVSNGGLNGNDWIEIEWIKMEVGEIATLFSPRSYDEELRLCRRYYQIYGRKASFSTSRWLQGVIVSAEEGSANFEVPIFEMRIAPTVSDSSGVEAFALRRGNGAGNLNGVTLSLVNSKKNYVCIKASLNTITANDVAYFLGTYNAGIDFILDAEIYP